MLGAGLAAFVAFPAVEARLAAGMAGEPAVDAPVLVLSEVRVLVLGFASVLRFGQRFSQACNRKSVSVQRFVRKSCPAVSEMYSGRWLRNFGTSIDDGRPSRRNAGLKVGVRW